MTPPPPATTSAAPPHPLPLTIAPVRLPAGSASWLARHLEARAWARLRVFVDLVVLSLASLAALLGGAGLTGQPVDVAIAGGFPLLVTAILYVRASPDDKLSGSLLDTAANAIGVVSLGTMLVLALESTLGSPHPLNLALRLWVLALVSLGLARSAMLSSRRYALRNRLLATPTLIFGAGTVGEHLVRRLDGDARFGLRPVGFLDSDPMPDRHPSTSTGVPVLGGSGDLADAIQRTGARQVILAFSAEPDRSLVSTVAECQRLGVSVAMVPRLYESVSEHATMDHVGGLPLIWLRPTDPLSWRFIVKHAIDRVMAAGALFALAPLMVMLALLVRFSSPGPVLFRQRRVGRDGRHFDVFKFRTMRDGGSVEPVFTLPDGCAPGGVEGFDRRTPVGRILRDTSLDELPQLINVLRGEMSIVGPRPERPEYVERFSAEIDRYEDRHLVKSGITGWAQVHGLRGQTSIADRVELDNYYIRNWSLKLDLRIVLLTVSELLRLRSTET